ncbi:MAG: exodeoxyribonuclease VII large subunit [Methanobacteriaceae archaeon]
MEFGNYNGFKYSVGYADCECPIFGVNTMENDIYTVSSLTKYIKRLFDENSTLRDVSIKGEISNFKAYNSGHLYFSLKDKDSVIKCVMFKNNARQLILDDIRIKDGISVVASGNITVYEKYGNYQFYVKSIEQEGIGELYKKYHQLKNKLELEGLFKEEHKKPLPFLPKRIGIITSTQGAVIRDIINVASRRYDKIDILIFPSLVQGDLASINVIRGIKELNKDKYKLDAIVIARGGGSFEDLFCFNDENLAREIFSSKLPIVSAVGHEPDFTICDFVADLRAPTPSAAAEILYPHKTELLAKIDTVNNRLYNGILHNFNKKKSNLDILRTQRLEKIPQDKINNASIHIDNLINNSKIHLNNLISNRKQEMIKQISLLDSYSPLKTLERGYSVVQTNDGKLVSKVSDVKKNDKINIKVADGTLNATID